MFYSTPSHTFSAFSSVVRNFPHILDLNALLIIRCLDFYFPIVPISRHYIFIMCVYLDEMLPFLRYTLKAIYCQLFLQC